MPCYLQDNVERQRGKGVFDASIRGLQKLNAIGYGRGAGGRADPPPQPPRGGAPRPPLGPLDAGGGGEYAVCFSPAFSGPQIPPPPPGGGGGGGPPAPRLAAVT